jgi:hypothetical protein
MFAASSAQCLAGFFTLSVLKLSGPIFKLSFRLSFAVAESSFDSGPAYNFVESAVVAGPELLQDVIENANSSAESNRIKFFFITGTG